MANIPQFQQETLVTVAKAQANIAQITGGAAAFTNRVTQISYIESSEAYSVAQFHQDAQLTMAQNQYGLYIGTANLQYNAAIFVASTESLAINSIALYDSNNVTAEANAEVTQVQGSATAEIQDISQEAAIQASGTSQNATIQATTITSQASIQVARTSTLASIQSNQTLISAQIDYAQGIVVATEQALEATQEAAIQVPETTQEATVQVNQTNADATIAASLNATLAATEVNRINVDAAYQVLQIQGIAAQGYRGDTVAATIRATETVSAANVTASGQISVATTRFGYELYAAIDRQSGIHYRANQDLAATEFEVNQSSNLTQYRANIGYQTDVVVATSDLQGAQYSADGDYTRRTTAAATESVAREFSANQDYAGVLYQQNTQTATLQARLAYLLAKWNLFFPLWQASEATRYPPGFNQSLPEVYSRQKWSPSQIQVKVNRGYADAHQQQSVKQLDMYSDYAGRGLTYASPAATVERLSLISQRLRSIALANSTGRLGLIAENADAVLQMQTLRSKLFLAQQQAYVSAQGDQIRRQIGYLDELTSVVGGL